MTVTAVTLAAEGALDLAVLRRLALDAGLTPGREYGRQGKSQIDKRLLSYNAAARHEPWIVLRDLDMDRECAALLVAELLPAPAPLMIFRIAVREVEAWLLSDTNQFKAAFKVAARDIPALPEGLDRPKVALLDAVSRSTNREIRSAMVTRLPNGSITNGPEYNALLEEFAGAAWQPKVAATRAPSLAKARRRIQELSKRILLK